MARDEVVRWPKAKCKGVLQAISRTAQHSSVPPPFLPPPCSTPGRWAPHVSGTLLALGVEAKLPSALRGSQTCVPTVKQ